MVSKTTECYATTSAEGAVLGPGGKVVSRNGHRLIGHQPASCPPASIDCHSPGITYLESCRLLFPNGFLSRRLPNIGCLLSLTATHGSLPLFTFATTAHCFSRLCSGHRENRKQKGSKGGKPFSVGEWAVGSSRLRGNGQHTSFRTGK